MKNDTDDRRNLCSIEAAPDKISVFFQHLVPGASVKSSRSNDTPTGLSNSKSGERDYDTFVVARRVASTINSRDSADRRLNRRCSFSKLCTLSIVFYYVSVCSRAVIRPLCLSLFAVSCPRMNRDARLRVTNRKAILRLFIAATPLYLEPAKCNVTSFSFRWFNFQCRYEPSCSGVQMEFRSLAKRF